MSGLERDFAELMPDTVLVEPWTGQDVTGNPSFGPAVTYQGYVAGQTKQIRTREGKVVVATKALYLLTLPATPLTPKDRVTLPAGSIPLQPPILDVNPYSDALGAYAVVVDLG